MGTERRRSSDRALSRVRLPTSERETLLPCPACDGVGRRLVERKDGTYKSLICRWCEGNGFVDHRMFKVFRRWLSILNHNRLHNACESR